MSTTNIYQMRPAAIALVTVALIGETSRRLAGTTAVVSSPKALDNVERCGQMIDGTKRNKKHSNSPQRGGLRFWITLAVAFLILFMVGLGQWDLAVAGFIGLIIGNGLGVLFGKQ